MIKNVKKIIIPLVVVVILLFGSVVYWKTKIVVNYKIFSQDYEVFELRNFKRFTPEKKDIEKSRELIKHFLSDKDEIRGMDDYNVQYFGFIDEGGNKNIWANYICRSNTGTDWQNDLTLVLDGGNCYFNLKVNLDTGKVFDFLVNGEA